MVAYYPHNITAWMDGTESLSDGEYRVYHIVCQLIYLQEGPVVLHEQGIAGRCNQHLLAFRGNLKKLIVKKKLVLTDDGKLTNRRAESELNRITGGSKNTTRTPRRPPADPPPTSAEPPRGQLRKPLKTKEPELLLTRLTKSSESPIGDSAPSAPLDERTKLFRDGLAMLSRITGKPEDRCRPLVGKWLRAVNDDAVVVRRAIEDAERNRVLDPVPWIERALRVRGGEQQRGGNAFAQLRRELRERSCEGDDDGSDAQGDDPGRSFPALPAH